MLRGPQGTLYGAASPGGVIKVVNAAPKFEFGASAGMELANFNAKRADFTVNAPVSDKLALRLATSLNDRDGYLIQGQRPGLIFGGGNGGANLQPGGDAKLDAEHDWSVRGSALYQHSADTSLLISASVQHSYNSSYPPYAGLDVQFAADHSFRCQAVIESDWHSAIAPVWEYEFTAGTDAAYPPLHSAELDFVFGHLRNRKGQLLLMTLADQMQRYWVNFARTGNPNGPGLPRWPRHSPSDRAYLELGSQGPVPGANLRAPTCSRYAEKLQRDIAARPLP